MRETPTPSWHDVESLLERLRAVLSPRVGRRAATAVLANLWGMRESGAGASIVLGAAHATFDAYARIPESGAPFSPALCKAIADAGCRKLAHIDSRLGWRRPLRGLDDAEARAVAQHADLLLPAYGDDDVAFAIAVAWKNALTFRQHLVIGKVFNRNENAPVEQLAAAVQQLGDLPADLVPVGVAPGDGVLCARGEGLVDDVTVRFQPYAWLYVPFRGDTFDAGTWSGAQALMARLAPSLDGQGLAWALHLAQLPFAFRAVARVVEVNGGAADGLGDIAAREAIAEDGPGAASFLLGAAVQVEPPFRSIVLDVDGTRVVLGAGEVTFT